MRTAIVLAGVLVVGGLAAFNFSDLSSGEDPAARVAESTAGDAPSSAGPGAAAPAKAVDASAAAEDGDDATGDAEGAARTDEPKLPPPAPPTAATEPSDAVPAPASAAATERDDGERRWRSRWYRRPEPDLSGWTRPEGPPRIALQAGHWKAHEAPDEQAGLRTNGTRGGGRAEWEVNLAIARRAAALLEAQGFTVDVLPTTIPPNYWADVFVSVHADGNNSTSVSGYRAASPRRDRTGRAEALAELLTRTYGEATGLPHYPTITRRMRSYYAFNYRRYEHSLHPMTVGVILETGFLTNPRDRRIIVDAPERAARGIADAIAQFLTPPPTP